MSKPSRIHSRSDVQSDGVARIFDPQALGASFQHLAVDVVRGETTDFTSQWFRARNGEADLVIWTDSEKRIIKHQLCFFGQVVEWSPIHGTRTGFVFEEEMISPSLGLEHPPEIAEHIKFDMSAQNQAVQQAVRLLLHVPSLNEADRVAMVFNFRKSPKLHKRARDRALKAWAPKVEEINSSVRSPFWKRLKNWVLGD